MLRTPGDLPLPDGYYRACRGRNVGGAVNLPIQALKENNDFMFRSVKTANTFEYPRENRL